MQDRVGVNTALGIAVESVQFLITQAFTFMSESGVTWTVMQPHPDLPPPSLTAG